jgi:hypothetical protein
LWVLQHELRQYHYHESCGHRRTVRRSSSGSRAHGAELSVLTGYDLLSFRYIYHPLPYRKIALPPC